MTRGDSRPTGYIAVVIWKVEPLSHATYLSNVLESVSNYSDTFDAGVRSSLTGRLLPAFPAETQAPLMVKAIRYNGLLHPADRST